jgi:hypothetical protein
LQTRTSIDDILGGNESEKIEIECRFTWWMFVTVCDRE